MNVNTASREYGDARMKVLHAHTPAAETSYHVTEAPSFIDIPETDIIYGRRDAHAVPLPFTDYTTGLAVETPFILANPIDASSPLVNAVFVAGKVVWIKAHNDFVNKLLVAEAAGVVGVVFFNDDPRGDTATFEEFTLFYDFTGTTIPSCVVGRENGLLITGYLGGDENNVANYQMKTDNTTVHSGIITNGRHSALVEGEFIIGVIRDDRVVRALREQGIIGPSDAAPAKYGYITHFYSAFSFIGDSTLLDWVEQDNPILTENIQIARLMAARVIEYFNNAGVSHIICDIRNVSGGSSYFWDSMQNLSGGDREFNGGFSTAGGIVNIQNIDPAGVQWVTDGFSRTRIAEDAGAITYDYLSSSRACYPSDWESIVSKGFPANGFFRGTPGNPKKILWFTNSTTISATQDAYTSWKGTSRDTTEFDGDLGNNTNFIGYGCYYRPFSTGGNYDTYLNWYTRGRTGEEDLVFAPMWSIDRWDIGRVAYIVRSQYLNGFSEPSTGGVLKALGQDFTRYHQPQLKWDMNADIFFQDIGYTVQDSDKFNVGVVDVNVGTRVPGSAGTSGFTVTVSIAGTASSQEAIDVNVAGSSASSVDGKYFILYDNVGSVAFWYSTGSTVEPIHGANRSIMISLVSLDTDLEIAQKTQVSINADSKFNAYLSSFDSFNNNCTPWVSRRHPAGEVNFYNALTWRDTALEKAFAILIDPNVETHYYKDDGYYYLN